MASDTTTAVLNVPKEGAPERAKGWHLPWNLITSWAVAVAAIWLLAAYLGRHVPPARHGLTLPRTPVQALSTWDGLHYEHIAVHGYSAHGVSAADGPAARRLAFFPLLPAASRLLGGRHNPALAGVILSQFCLLGSLLLLGQLAGSNRGVPLRLQPGFWLLISPMAFFFSFFYSESLTLFLTLAMVVAYRRERFVLAAACGFLAGLARPTAILIPALFLVDVVRRVRRGERWLAALATAVTPWAGLGLYVGFVGYLLRDPLGYPHMQNLSTWGVVGWGVPFRPLYLQVKAVVYHVVHGYSVPPAPCVYLFSSLGILALIIWGRKRIDPGFVAYLIAGMLLIHSREPWSPRHELMLFPAYLLLPQTFLVRRWIAPIATAVFVAAQFFLFRRQATWQWVG